MIIRPATDTDLAEITVIYNQYVVDSYVSFDADPWTIEQRREWFSHYGGDSLWQVWVAVDGEAVVGAAWSSGFRSKDGYRFTVETTIVLDVDATGRGIGTLLYSTLLDDIDTRGAHRAIALISLPNDVSIALHHKLGFETLSVQDEVGYKLGRYWSTAMLQRKNPRDADELNAGDSPR